jgi:hypothetical protein
LGSSDAGLIDAEDVITCGLNRGLITSGLSGGFIDND